jgi:hypothetical protein
MVGQAMRMLFRAYVIAKNRGNRPAAKRALLAHLGAARQLRSMISTQHSL